MLVIGILSNGTGARGLSLEWDRKIIIFSSRQVVDLPDREEVSSLLSSVGCQENEVIALSALPGWTLLSNTDGSVSSIDCWTSCKWIAELSR